MKFILNVSFIFFISSIALSQEADTIFNNANEYYKSGKYNEAVEEYNKIILQGYKSPELYFNMGNAYYRLEKLGQAILFYERAKRLNPSDEDINHNLKLAYLKTIDRIEPVPELFLIEWMRSISMAFSINTLQIIFVISWILLFCSLALMYFLKRSKIISLLRIVFFTSIIFVAISLLLYSMQIYVDSDDAAAIITNQTVTAKSSPDENSMDAFVIHEGAKVVLKDYVNQWVKILLADGKIGWITAENCEKI